MNTVDRKYVVIMNEIDGMSAAFKQAKMMWFPTNRKSRKVEDIEKNQKALITFPSEDDDEYYEISGKAEFEDDRVTAEKWKWWYLFWHPAQRKRFWFPGGSGSPDRMIINVYPESARVVKRD
jgi:general stress protein 26